MTRPFRNLILLIVDALRYDALSCRGGGPLSRKPVRPAARLHTPALDRLAAEGVRFDRCLSSGAHTPPCVTTILTGLFPERHGLRTHYRSLLSPDAAPLGEHLKRAGFATAMGNRMNRSAEKTGNYGLARGVDRTFSFRAGRDYLARETKMIADATEWMRRRRAAGKRFGVSLIATQVHDYFSPDYLRRHPRGDRASREVYQQGLVRGPLARQVSAYVRSANHFDAALLSRWLADWESAGLLEDTLLCVTSDHGEALRPENRSHGLTLRDEDVRVPLLFHGGRLPRPGKTIDALVRTADILPTALDLLGLPVPGRLDGRSLVPHMQGRRPPPAAARAEMWLPVPLGPSAGDYLRTLRGNTLWPDDLYQVCLQEGDDKAVRDFFRGRYYFYDLGRDPLERRPAARPRNTRQARLFRALKRVEAPARLGRTPPWTVRRERAFAGAGRLY